MKLKDIIDFIDEKIPPKLALDFDNVGFAGDYDLNQNIDSIKIFMDLYQTDDDFDDGTLIIVHHPPLFKPVTPTYIIHSNWDIIDGGANEALAETLKLNVCDYFDKSSNIGRVCNCEFDFEELVSVIKDNFNDARIVNNPPINLNRIGIVSGFGLKNPDYIKLAFDKELDLLISGDLTQETAVLAKNLGVCLIDLGHHASEVPGLYGLSNVLSEIDVDVEVVDNNPIQKL